MVMRRVLLVLRVVNELQMPEKTVLRKVVGHKRDKQSDTVGGEGIT